MLRGSQEHPSVETSEYNVQEKLMFVDAPALVSMAMRSKGLNRCCH